MDPSPIDDEKLSVFQDEAVRRAIVDPVLEHSDFPLTEDEFLRHITVPPMFTVIRVNTIVTDRASLIDHLNHSLVEQYKSKDRPRPEIAPHPQLPDAVVLVSSRDADADVAAAHPRVIVGLKCGVAVLRGAQVYAPGVLGVPEGLSCGDRVSVFADIEGRCLRGWSRPFTYRAVFVGNGVLLRTRRDLFTVDEPKGVAVEMTQRVLDCPSLGDLLADERCGLQRGFLQNLPSVVCGHVLDVRPDHRVLDMCAAPGGKTTHLAALMHNQGRVVALDKSAAKVRQIVDNAARLGLHNVDAFAIDAVRAVDDAGSDALATPPFRPQSFDRILVDAPCSALGQRPQLYNPMRFQEMQSFARLQKKLLASAHRLLADGGRLVYSTCTYNVAENEDVVRWALANLAGLRLAEARPRLGRPAFGMDDPLGAMQRFGPCSSTSVAGVDTDTIGFFICCFVKADQ